MKVLEDDIDKIGVCKMTHLTETMWYYHLTGSARLLRVLCMIRAGDRLC